MELVFEDEEKLIPLYLGIKYKADDTKVLYLNTIFRTVKEAERKNKAYVDLGQTSYYPKVMSGALVENIYYGFWAKGSLMRFLIKNVLGKYLYNLKFQNMSICLSTQIPLINYWRNTILYWKIKS